MKVENSANNEIMIGYNSKYWEFQKEIGGSDVHSIIQKRRYQKYIKNTDTVLDFGCGGGYTLKEIECKSKYGIEINEYAIEKAKSYGINVKKGFEDLESVFFDVIISNSALEHVPNPSEVILQCFRVLKHGGVIVFSVPHEELSNSYCAEDINQHLYTWSPMNLGNLFKYCGFQILEIKVIKLKQPPLQNFIYKLFGVSGVLIIGRIYRAFRYVISDIVKNIGVSADILIIAKK
jgi:SAM-dependent methyltransferase